MTDLGEVLARLGLSHYLERLIDEGFEKWETVLDITEQDLATLTFKLGHRRILQREIASSRGISLHQALPLSYFSSLDESYDGEDQSCPKSYKSDPAKGNPTGKRKYRRHPKPDEHAPEKPPSAYVMFANRVRDELKGQNLSFTDIAKLVGEKWKVLGSDHKEEFEFEASVAKEKYNSELAEYKKTESYKDHLQYLSDFKQRMGKETSEPSEAHRKRPKLDTNSGSNGGMGNAVASCSGSGSITLSGSSSTAKPSAPASAGKVSSTSSATTTSTPSTFPSPSAHSPSTPLPSSSGIQPRSTSSPVTSPIYAVAGYRDALLRTTQEQQQETFIPLGTSHEMDPISFPRIHPTSAHIQQQLSYSRHQPSQHIITPPFSRSSNTSAGSSTSMRRPSLRTDDSLSSSGSPSTPSSTPLEDGQRSYHRALPLPTPIPGNSAGVGYFDQRPLHHTGQSPRTHIYPPLPGPTQLIVQSSHSLQQSQPANANTSQPSSSGSPSILSSRTLSSGGSLTPSSQPPSS